MKTFSYGVEFYHKEIFDLDETEKFKREVEIAEKTEEYFMRLTNQEEVIRTNILLSYRFKKDLSLEDRINYVRGITYSRQFMNEEDVFELFKEFDKKDKKAYEKSLFSIRDFSDEFDYAFYFDYLDNYLKDDNKKEIEQSAKIHELVKQAKARYEEIMSAPSEDLVKDDSVKLEDREKDIYDDYPEEDFEDDDKPINKVSMDNLSLMERLVLSKEYYPVYQKGLFKGKDISEDKPCYKLIKEGMDDYNRYRTNLYQDTYNFLKQEFFRTMKNLTFVI